MDSPCRCLARKLAVGQAFTVFDQTPEGLLFKHTRKAQQVAAGDHEEEAGDAAGPAAAWPRWHHVDRCYRPPLGRRH